jgi:flagellar biosynthesis protein FlhG
MTTEKHKALRIALISGKGGVGKSVITLNLAAALSSLGRKTLAVDADLGLASLDVILDISPQSTIFDALHRGSPLDEALIHTTKGFDLLPAGSGLPEGTMVTQALAESVEAGFSSLEDRYDIFLLDAGAGIGDVVLFFANLAHEILLVVTPEPTSVMDAYATIKILHQNYGRSEFLLVVNQADPDRSDQVGASIAGHLRNVISRYLESDPPVRLELIGSIPRDPAIPRAVRHRQLLVETDPKAPAIGGIARMADFLEKRISKSFGI